MTDFDQFARIVTQTLFFGSLPHWQAEPLRMLIAEGERRNQSVERIAYVLATAHHETRRFRYMEEVGRGEGRLYGKPIRLIDSRKATFHGRGFVQLTWLANYAKMSLYLTQEHGREIDLVNNPDLAEAPAVSSLIIWEGMVRGMFTGRSLADYISGTNADYVGARRIVNGTDRAEQIAEYARLFEAALKSARQDVAA
jgi:hypothetical protein